MHRVLIPVALSASPPSPIAQGRVRQWAGETMGTTWSVSAVLGPGQPSGFDQAADQRSGEGAYPVDGGDQPRR